MTTPMDASIHLQTSNAKYTVEEGGTLNMRVGHDIHFAPAAPKPQLRPCPAPSPNHVARPTVEARIANYFFGTQNSPHRLVLHGLGGSGKTDIASKFAHTYFYSLPLDIRRFSEVYYVDATTTETMTESFQSIGRAVAAGDAWTDALHYLENQISSNWLMICDNADNPKIDLNHYLPKCSHGNIIITTRNYEARLYGVGCGSDIEVSDMAPSEALKLLLARAGIEEAADSKVLIIAQHLVQELHYFPLAISQAGAYMRAKSCSVDRYMKLFTTCRDSLYSDRINANSDRHCSTHATWLISYKQLSPPSSLLFHLCGFMYRGGVSEQIFTDAHDGIRRYLEQYIPFTKEQRAALTTVINFLRALSPNGKWETPRFSAVMGELRSFSLVSYEPGCETYTIHPLVHQWARTLPPPAVNVQLCASLLLGASVPRGSTLVEYVRRKALLLHLDSMLDGFDISLIDPNSSNGFALVYKDAGQHEKCTPFRLNTLEVWRTVLGEEHPQTLVSMSNLASSYSCQGRYSEAESVQIKVLGIQRRLLGEKHTHTLTSINNLATIYRNQHRFTEAESMYKKALWIQQKMLGEKHPHTLASMNNLASTYRSQGCFDKAEVLQVKVVAIRREVLGEEHPQTLASMSKLALTYSDKNCFNEAESLQVIVLEIQKKILGEEHRDTLVSLNNLAATRRNQGRATEAEALYIKALEMQRKVLGEEHPNIFFSMNGLALTYKILGRLTEAELVGINALENRKKVLGEEHPDTLISVQTLQEIRYAMRLDLSCQSPAGDTDRI